MELSTTLEDLRRTSSQCLRCLTCTYSEWPENDPLCPIYQRHRVYTASPGGLIYLLRALVDRHIEPNATMAEFAYQCTLCEKCDICEIVPIAPPHATPADLVRFLRHELFQHRMIPEAIEELYEKFQKDGDFKGEKATLKISEKLKNEHAETAFFVEGIHSAGEREIYQSAIRLLEKMGTGVKIFDLGGGRCGTELYDLGFWDELITLLEKRAALMKQLDDKEVLFINPHAHDFMTRRYPEIAPEAPQIRDKHFSQLLKEGFEQGRLKAKKKEIKASYHDPCHLSRGLGIHEAPRTVLSLLGVELVEMKRNRGNTYCCGAGGSIQTFPNFSNWVATERIREFKETRADLLITACPYCKEQLQRVLPLEEKDRVRDLIEFVDEQTE